MIEEIRQELTGHLIPFWMGMRDDEHGGYTGFMDFDLKKDVRADKGCILMSRITWFFAGAYLLLRDGRLLDEARHGYEFLREHCFDEVNGGVFWSVTFDGKPADRTKHTYNQAFAIYALSSYYDASGEEEALVKALELYRLIESRMRDEGGYLEAFDETFGPASNEKLSENGVVAARTMNTLLHVMEAYTELLRVLGPRAAEDFRKRADVQAVRASLCEALDILADRIYEPDRQRLGVFFDRHYRPLLDLYSYGHDIEAAWLIDRAVEVLAIPEYREKMAPITRTLTERIYALAFDGRSVPVECEDGAVKEDRVWWVQAEAINGFVNGYEKDPSRREYLEAAVKIWNYTRAAVIDPRPGSEWYWCVGPDGAPAREPIVEPWKCPYHNGRMCLEVIRRGIDAE